MTPPPTIISLVLLCILGCTPSRHNKPSFFPTHPNKAAGSKVMEKQSKCTLPDVQWEWQGDAGWKAYDSAVCAKVTEGMCAGEETVMVQVRVTIVLIVRTCAHRIV